jgi:hypothetical protein
MFIPVTTYPLIVARPRRTDCTFNVAAILAADHIAVTDAPVDAQMLKADEQIADDGAMVRSVASTRELMARESAAEVDANSGTGGANHDFGGDPYYSNI